MIFRPLSLCTFLAAALAGLHLYQSKHEVALLDRELRGIGKSIDEAHERSQALHAEWAWLNEPERLRGVAMRHLQLEPMQPSQFLRLNEAERRLPTVVAYDGPPALFAARVPAAAEGPVRLALLPRIPDRVQPVQLATAAADDLPIPPPAPIAAPIAAPVSLPLAEAPAKPAAPPVRPAAEAPRPAAPVAEAPAPRPAPAPAAEPPAPRRAPVLAARPAEPAPRPAELAARPAALRLPPPRPAPRATEVAALPPVTAPIRPIAAPVRPAVAHIAPPVAPPVPRHAGTQLATAAPLAPPRPAEAPAVSLGSALGGGRPMLAPPVPFGSANAAMLGGAR